MKWKPEQIELLKKLWAEGLSATQCANRIGGFTRNACIGQVHRLGLSGRAHNPANYARSPRKRRDRTFTPKPEPIIFAEPEMPKIWTDEHKVHFMKAPTHGVCVWPLWGEGVPLEEKFYCGTPTATGEHWCWHHSNIGYNPTQPHREAPQHHGRKLGLRTV